MGYGSWTTTAATNYATTKGFASLDDFKNSKLQEIYKSYSMPEILNPRDVMREACDSEDHPNSKPIIIGLDVTGSMGSAAEAVAHQLNDIMTEIYKTTPDVQFCTAAIGDFSYDDAPLQVSQFESDIRIAEQLDKVYFEGGGGGNKWESYTAAWYFGLEHTKLDCYDKRGQRGVIITIGDEGINPYLPYSMIKKVFGDKVQGDIDTKKLYEEASKKFDIWHIGFSDKHSCYDGYKARGMMRGWEELLGDHFVEATEQTLTKVISDIIANSFNGSFVKTSFVANESNEICW